MEIKLNNKTEHIPDYSEMSISQLLKYKNFTFKFLAVRINGKPVLTEDYDSAMIQDGDNVLVLHLISGG